MNQEKPCVHVADPSVKHIRFCKAHDTIECSGCRSMMAMTNQTYWDERGTPAFIKRHKGCDVDPLNDFEEILKAAMQTYRIMITAETIGKSLDGKTICLVHEREDSYADSGGPENQFRILVANTASVTDLFFQDLSEDECEETKEELKQYSTCVLLVMDSYHHYGELPKKELMLLWTRAHEDILAAIAASKPQTMSQTN